MKMCKNLEIISDKKKRVRSRACALTRRTAYIENSARTNDWVGSLPLANYSVDVIYERAKKRT